MRNSLGQRASFNFSSYSPNQADWRIEAMVKALLVEILIRGTHGNTKHAIK